MVVGWGKRGSRCSARAGEQLPGQGWRPREGSSRLLSHNTSDPSCSTSGLPWSTGSQTPLRGEDTAAGVASVRAETHTWGQQIHVHLRLCKASCSAQLAIIFSPLWKKKKRAVYCCRRSEKANQKATLSSGGSHQCPVSRNGSGMDLEGAGFHRRERSGLRGRRKGGQTMGREVKIH